MCWGTCAGINSDLAPMNEKSEGYRVTNAFLLSHWIFQADLMFSPERCFKNAVDLQVI